MEKEKKKKGEKEKVSEIFEVENKGEEKTIHTQGVEEEKAPSEEQMKKEKKTFRNIIIVMVVFALAFFSIYLILNSMKVIDYNGVKFEIVKQGSLTFYSTSLPVTYNGTSAQYYFYLRTDPRILKNVVFDGELTLKTNMVVNMTDSFNCNGDGIIATANLVKLYSMLGTNVIKDDNASCDVSGKYTFLKIQPGNETKVEQFGPSCYNIYVNNCEILKGTERFMLETFVEVNKLI